jgi:xanthine/CO dehydrogenase XdhC/CoxF family maturation factor
MLSPHLEFVAALSRLTGGEPFAVATVVAVHGSSAAKPGAKMLVRADGVNACGWVGGGCAERFVIDQALEAIAARQPRQVSVDLEDEVFGVGMPCGGSMDVFIEPVLPPRRLLLPASHALSRSLSLLAAKANIAVVAVDSIEASEVRADDIVLYFDADGQPDLNRTLCIQSRDDALNRLAPEELSVRVLAELLARERGRSARPLREVKGLLDPAARTPAASGCAPELLLVGHNRITESLAEIAVLLNWPVTVCAADAAHGNYPPDTRLQGAEAGIDLPPITPATCAVVATQHKGDHLSLTQLLASPAAYIGLIASARRTRLVLELLDPSGGMPDALYAPAGVDIGAITPFEIALSISAEIVGRRHGALPPALAPTPP